MKRRMEQTLELMKATGLADEPFGVYYADEKPEGAYGPKEGVEVSRELEAQNKIDWAEMRKTFSCLIGNLWLARKKKKPHIFRRRNTAALAAGSIPVFTRNTLISLPVT